MLKEIRIFTSFSTSKQIDSEIKCTHIRPYELYNRFWIVIFWVLYFIKNRSSSISEIKLGFIIYVLGGVHQTGKSEWERVLQRACWEAPSDQPLSLSQMSILHTPQSYLPPAISITNISALSYSFRLYLDSGFVKGKRKRNG